MLITDLPEETESNWTNESLVEAGRYFPGMKCNRCYHPVVVDGSHAGEKLPQVPGTAR